MCGVAGVARPGRTTGADDVAAVARMINAQAHRGPDGHGLFAGEQVVLGHRRLAIVDLSPAGQQPMANEDRTVWVTYNGEIYNHRELRADLEARGHCFESMADTETLVHGYEEWGIDGLLTRLRGMFAFALYDARRVRHRVSDGAPDAVLIMARDRLGIKPLYFADAAGDVVFSSEVKAMLRSGLVPAEEEPEALVGFLLLGSVPSPLTTVRGVRSVPPGCYVVVGRNGTAVRRYWDLGEAAAADERVPTDRDFVSRLRAELEDTVARHLVSDVPLGIFLSGGMDSCGLVALASRSGTAPVRTLTVAPDDPDVNEAGEAREVAERFLTDHTEVPVTGAEFMKELPHILAAVDQPTHDGVNTYVVARAARSLGQVVILSGVGGDEVFLGYPHYRWVCQRAGPLRLLTRLPRGTREALVRSASAVGRAWGREAWMRMVYLGRAPSTERVYMALRGFFPPRLVAELLDMDAATVDAAAVRYLEGHDGAQAEAVDLDAFNRLEIRRYLHDQLLRDTDTFSMAHGVEVRVPYLDHRIVELAAAIPPRARINGNAPKPLLAEALQDLRVDGTRGRKRGFTLPLDRWMRAHADALEACALDTHLVDRRAVRRLWRAFRNGRLHWSRAWALVVLGSRRAA